MGHIKQKSRNAYMKFFLIVASILLLHSYVNSQSVEKIINPSVNAKQFISGLSSDVGLHTGQLALNFPLMSLPGKGIDIPVSLAFNPGDVTYQSESSHIGLGWSLMAGGVITATIRDMDDSLITCYDDVPWFYNPYYIEGLRDKEANNPYAPNQNLFNLGMSALQGKDRLPDLYNYSFLGYSGEIFFRFDKTKRLSDLYPNNSFKLEKTNKGYKIIGDDGTLYFFEIIETNTPETDSHVTSWFLSKIETMQRGVATFSYADESFRDLSVSMPSFWNKHPIFRSKRLTRIDSDYGYVLFNSTFRADLPGAERITKIELHDKAGELIKGYDIDNKSYFDSTSIKNTGYEEQEKGDNLRMKLNRIQEYNNKGQYLPPYEFTYNCSFYRSKSTYRTGGELDPSYVYFNCWATNPAATALVDRSDNGDPACFMVIVGYYNNIPIWEPVGFRWVSGQSDGSLSDTFLLTGLSYPSGIHETYQYEPHTYGYMGDLQKGVNPALEVRGRRIARKTISDNGVVLQTTDYKYNKGVLINPAIFTTAKYQRLLDVNGSQKHNRLQAIEYTTQYPQNSYSGVPVNYSEVEELFRTNTGETIGKNVYYFKNNIINPPVNYVYFDYDYNGWYANTLVNLKNRLYGTLWGYPEGMAGGADGKGYNYYNMSYLAFPLAPFDIIRRGQLFKKVTYNSQGEVVNKIVNDYGNQASYPLYGIVISHDYDGLSPDRVDKNRYHISLTSHTYDYMTLDKSTTTGYFKNPITAKTDSVVQVKSFSYYSGKRPASIYENLGNGKSLMTKYLYSDNVYFGNKNNLTGQASTIQNMVSRNVINPPIQTTVTQSGQYKSGSYVSFKQINNGGFAVDTIYDLFKKDNALLLDTYVDGSGKIVRSSSFFAAKQYLTYDSNGNPQAAKFKDEIPIMYKWGYNGQYLIAKIENYTQNQFEENSTLSNQLELLDDYTMIDDSNKTGFINCNQSIRNSLPISAQATTYTYRPLVGMTSATAPNGVTTYYEYDAFNRLKRTYIIENNVEKTVQTYDYHYQGQ